jgi:hypothetical protein
MVLFAFAAVVTLLGIGVYDLYNPGHTSVTMAGYHFAAVPNWVPVALGAAVPLSFFLLHALWTGFRIWLLKITAPREPEWDLVEQWPPAPRRVETTRPQPLRAPAEAPAARAPIPRAPIPRAPAPRAPVAEAPVANPRRRRASQAPPPTPSPQPAPKRSWLTHRD